jgi:hypothetical protein
MVGCLIDLTDYQYDGNDSKTAVTVGLENHGPDAAATAISSCISAIDLTFRGAS